MVPTELELNHRVLLERLFILISNLLENESKPGEMKEKVKFFIEVVKIVGILATCVLTCMTEYERFKEKQEKAKV